MEPFQRPEQQRSRMQTIGRALSGFGAGFQGRGPEYLAMLQAQDQALDEQRKQAMVTDALQTYNLLGTNNIDDAMGLVDNRVQMINELGGDPSDTLEIYDMLRQGNVRGAQQMLGEFLQSPEIAQYLPQREQPEILSANQVQNGQVVSMVGGRPVATPIEGYTSPAQDENLPADIRTFQFLSDIGALNEEEMQRAARIRLGTEQEFTPRTTSYNNGTTLQISRSGEANVYVPGVGKITDPAQIAQAVQAGMESGIQQAAAQEGAVQSARGRSQRAEGIINAGVEASKTVPSIMRSIDLLQSVETGGLQGAMLRARAMFGVESADEGELAYNLARNVLSQLKPIFGAAFTEREGARLERIEASLGRNTETNIRLLNQVLDVANSAVEKAYDRALESDDMATARELESILDMFNVPPIPAEFSDVITPDVWRNMTRDERGAFSEGQ